MREIGGRETDTRSAILGATMELLDGRDSRHVHVRDVAEQANVGAPTIYYYFESRERLLAFAQVERLSRIFDETREQRRLFAKSESNDPDGPREAAREILRYWWSPAAQEGHWKVIEVLAEVRRDPEARAILGASIARGVLDRAQNAERLQELGVYNRDVDPLALTIFQLSAAIGQVFATISPELKLSDEAKESLFEWIINATMPPG